MANYLIKGGAVQPLADAGRRPKSDIIHVDNMYKFQIYNKAGTITFDGYVPPEFVMSLQSSWQQPFASTSVTDVMGKGADWLGGRFGIEGGGSILNGAGKVMKLGGASTFIKAASAKMWAGPSYLVLSLPLFVDAYSDTKSEVIQKTVDILSLATPSEGIGGLLLPPGPIPAFSVMNEVMGSSENPIAEDKESFTLQIGNFFKMYPVVINSVTATMENVVEDVTGNPLACDFVMQISSYFAVTREDLREWFGLPREATSQPKQTGGVSTP